MTARTAESQAHESCPCRVDHVVKFVLPLHERQVDVRTFDEIVWPCDKVRRGFRSADGISRDLFFQKLIIRFVIIERPNDVVAIRPCIRAFAVGFVAVGFRKPHKIQPVARPALTVVRIRKHSFHKLAVSLRIRIRDKRTDVFRSRRQAEHVEGDPSNQFCSGRLRIGRQRVIRELLENESIDSVGDPRIVSRRWLARADRLKRPMIRLHRFVVCRTIRPWPHRTLIDPGLQQLNFIFRQLIRLIRRHSLAGFSAADQFHQMTMLTVSCDDGRLSGISAAQHRRSTIQPQMTLLRVGAVAVKALGCKERLDLGPEVNVIHSIDTGVRDKQQDQASGESNGFHMVEAGGASAGWIAQAVLCRQQPCRVQCPPSNWGLRQRH